LEVQMSKLFIKAKGQPCDVTEDGHRYRIWEFPMATVHQIWSLEKLAASIPLPPSMNRLSRNGARDRRDDK
jgi:hypothetical protein